MVKDEVELVPAAPEREKLLGQVAAETLLQCRPLLCNAVRGRGARPVLRLRLLALAAAAAIQVGCATHGNSQCAAGAQVAVNEWLYFGTAKPSGSVSPEEWETFLAKSVTPRFPAGLSVWPASGQWQSAQGSIVKEATYLLNVVYPPSESSERAVRDVVAEYKLQFQQEAVLRVKSHACMAL